MLAVDLLAWTQTMLLHDDPALAKPNRRRCATGCCTSPPASSAAAAGSGSASTRHWPWATHLAAAFDRCAALPQPAP